MKIPPQAEGADTVQTRPMLKELTEKRKCRQGIGGGTTGVPAVSRSQWILTRAAGNWQERPLLLLENGECAVSQSQGDKRQQDTDAGRSKGRLPWPAQTAEPSACTWPGITGKQDRASAPGTCCLSCGHTSDIRCSQGTAALPEIPAHHSCLPSPT